MPKKMIALVSLFFITLIIFGIFLFFDNSKQSIPIDISIQMFPGMGTVEIDSKSILLLEDSIRKSILINDSIKLAQIFENERTKYIDLITVISILLTVFSLFTIFNNFLNKDDFKKLENDLRLVLEETRREISKLQWNTKIQEINNYSDSISKGNGHLISDENKSATNINDYINCIAEDLNEHLRFIADKKLISKDNFKDFCISLLTRQP